MISDRRPKQRGRRAAKTAVAAEHKYLCGGLVYDRERIALAIPGCDNPAREFNHRIGHSLAWRKLIDGGDRLRGGLLGFGHAGEGRERQRQRAKNDPNGMVRPRTDGAVPYDESLLAPIQTTRHELCKSD